MQPVCTKDFLGIRFPRSPALRAKWGEFFVAKILIIGMISIFVTSTTFADDSPSSVFGDEVELRSSVAPQHKSKGSTRSQKDKQSRPINSLRAHDSLSSSSQADNISESTGIEKMTPRYGITLPQPMYKIVEPKPLYQIVEPKPLYDGVAPEIPGQKHMPDLSSRSSSSHRSSRMREDDERDHQKSSLPTMKKKITKDGVLWPSETNPSDPLSEGVPHVRIRTKTLRTTLDVKVSEKEQRSVPLRHNEKPQKKKQEKPVDKHVKRPKTLPANPSLHSSSRKKPQPTIEQSTPVSVPMAAEVYRASPKPSPRSSSLDSSSEEPLEASRSPSSKTDTASLNADALKRIQSQFKGQKADISVDQRPALTPETYLNTVRAADQYLGIAESGGWPSLPENTVLSPGARNTTVALLKKRLMISGDLGEKDAKNDMYDEALEQAVKTFQMRHGLPQTGTVSGASVEELNVSARVRYRQLKRTAERLSRQAFEFGGRYLSLNMAASLVEAVEDGRVQHRYKASIGSLERQTPPLQSQIMSVTLNPTWTVPLSVVKEDFIPKLQKNAQALAKTGIRVYDGKGQELELAQVDWQNPRAATLVFRQAASASNPLGRMRFDMLSSHGSDLHDAPSRKLFSQEEKVFSTSGVRVADIRLLASWILGEQSGQTPRTLQGLINTNMIHELKLSQPLPVIFTYMTGYANEDGQVHFRPDVYGLDERTLTSSQND
jgi:L,D-transpeptidase YcbB